MLASASADLRKEIEFVTDRMFASNYKDWHPEQQLTCFKQLAQFALKGCTEIIAMNAIEPSTYEFIDFQILSPLIDVVSEVKF